MAGLALYTSQGLSGFDRRLAEMDEEEEELLNPFSEGMGFSGSYQDSESPLGAYDREGALSSREKAPAWRGRQGVLVVCALVFAFSSAVAVAPRHRPASESKSKSPAGGGEEGAAVVMGVDPLPVPGSPLEDFKDGPPDAPFYEFPAEGDGDDEVWPHRPEAVQEDSLAGDPHVISGGLELNSLAASDPRTRPRPDGTAAAPDLAAAPPGGREEDDEGAASSTYAPTSTFAPTYAPSTYAPTSAGVEAAGHAAGRKKVADGSPADPKRVKDTDPRREEGGAPASSAGEDERCSRDGDETRCSYTASDFLAFANVRAFVDRVDGWDKLFELVPSRVDVVFDEALVEGHAYGAAPGGRYAFALYNGNGVDGTKASFLVVLGADGALASVVSTTDKDRGEMSTHFDPVKVVNPTTLATMSNDFMNEDGYAYTWAWREGADKDGLGDGLARLNDKIIFSSHDIQLEDGESSYWQTTGAHLDCEGECPTSFSRVDAATGGILEGVNVDHCRDVNSVQVVDDPSGSGARTAYVSCRLYNSVNAIDVDTGATLWIAGGDYGTLDVVDQRGEAYKAGESFWHGQHNPEWFAEDGVFLFDNAYTGEGDDKDTVASQTSHFPSRVLGFKVDADAKTARIFFEYVFFDEFPYGYSEVFGDADLLPSKNVLTSWWPAIQSPSRGLLFDTEILEVTRDGAKAWSAKIYGNAERTCTAEDWETNDATLDGCAQGISSGWKVYAPEKFYDAPVVYGATLDADGKLDFKAHAAFKSTRPMAASFALKQRGSTLAQGTFDFMPHWRATHVALSGVRAASDAPVLTVTDAWGQATSVDVAAAPS